jgi:glycosyltransferase involved in cell wall biosynthesis
MRVLHVGKALPPAPGGMETYLADLLRAQVKQGLEVAALVHEWPGVPAPHEPSFGGARIYTCPSHGQLVYAPLSPGFPWMLQRAIETFRPQLLHLHLPNTSAFAALLLPAARRLPWVLHWHADVDPQALDWRLRLAYRLYRPLETAMLRRAARVVVTSRAYLEASPTLGRWRARCEVVPLGIDFDRLPEAPHREVEEARAQWPCPSEPRFLAVGRLAYYKGFEVFLEALAQCPQGSLLVVGDGPRRTFLEQRVHQLGLGSRVRMMGSIAALDGQPVLAPYFAACDLLCLPSLDRSEAFGLVLLEARRYGRPVVASDVPGSGIRWVVETAGGGQLVAPGHAPSLATALLRAGMEAGRVAAAPEPAAVEALRSAFSIELGARRLTPIYERALASTARRAP